MTEQSTQDTRPHEKIDLERLVDIEIIQRVRTHPPDSAKARANVFRAAALDVAWAEIERLRTEQRIATGDVADGDAAGTDPREARSERPFPLRPDLHAARLRTRPDLVAGLRELSLILYEAFNWNGDIDPDQELVAAYVNDIANAAADQTEPTVPRPVDTPAVDGEIVELRTLRNDVARLVGIGPDNTDRIERSSLLAALTRTISLVDAAGELAWERNHLRAGIAQTLAEIDDTPCQHDTCPAPPTPLSHCSTCHIGATLRSLLAEDHPRHKEDHVVNETEGVRSDVMTVQVVNHPQENRA